MSQGYQAPHNHLPVPQSTVRPGSDDGLTPGTSADPSDAEGEDEVTEVPMVSHYVSVMQKANEQESAPISRGSFASEMEDEEFSGGEDEIEEGADYEDEDDYDDDDDPMDDEGDEEDDDPSFGERKKKKKLVKVKAPKEARSGASKPKKRESGRLYLRTRQANDLALAAFPTRKERSDSSDDDYGTKSHKKKKSARNSAQATPESGLADPDAAWRRGAAKKVVTYDEAEVDYGLESAEEEEKLFQAQEIAAFGGAADEIDQVLSHSRDEDRLSDPADIPQENLVCPLSATTMKLTW